MIHTKFPVKIDLPILEKIFEWSLPYMGVVYGEKRLNGSMEDV